MVAEQTRLRDPASVRIAEIAFRELDRLCVLYFSTNKLLHMLQALVQHAIFTSASPSGWFVMEYIPDQAVSSII